MSQVLVKGNGFAIAKRLVHKMALRLGIEANAETAEKQLLSCPQKMLLQSLPIMSKQAEVAAAFPKVVDHLEIWMLSWTMQVLRQLHHLIQLQKKNIYVHLLLTLVAWFGIAGPAQARIQKHSVMVEGHQCDFTNGCCRWLFMVVR